MHIKLHHTEYSWELKQGQSRVTYAEMAIERGYHLQHRTLNATWEKEIQQATNGDITQLTNRNKENIRSSGRNINKRCKDLSY